MAAITKEDKERVLRILELFPEDIKEGEIFNIDNYESKEFKFDANEGLLTRYKRVGVEDVVEREDNGSGWCLCSAPLVWSLILKRELKITKKPWVPKEGEEYWFCYYDVEHDEKYDTSYMYTVGHGIYSSIYWSDMTRVRNGNCFKTEKEARDNLENYKKWLLDSAPDFSWRK